MPVIILPNYNQLHSVWTFINIFSFSRVPPNAEAVDAFNDWHVAFHGTAPENVQKILDTGHLVLPGQFGIAM